jgi:hypothetical protein
MQIAQVVHAVVAVLFVAVILAHIYIGTLGMEGAFEAMGTGDVDSIGRGSITTNGSGTSSPSSKGPAGRENLQRRRPSEHGPLDASAHARNDGRVVV